MTIQLTEKSLRRMFPRGRSDYIKAFLDGAGELEKAGMLDERVWPMVAANIDAETGGCTIVSENMSYSAGRMRQVWPSRFRGPQGVLKSKRLAHNPRALANQVYGARLGNRGRHTDDGYDFRGKGPLQQTGRTMALWLQKITDIPFADDPSQAENPDNWVTVIILTWREHVGDLNHYAKAGNLKACCNGINRGNPRSRYNPIGWSHRKRGYRRALEVFGSVTIEPVTGTLRDGDDGPEVKAMQKRLVALGYHLGGVDGDFGDATEQALELFQKTNGLQKDGIYGPNTRKALWSEDAIKRPLDEKRATAMPEDLKELGSTEIKNAEAVQGAGLLLGGGTVAKTAIEEGPKALESLSAIAEKASLIETSSKALSGSLTWGANNLSILALIALGGLFWHFGGYAKLRRLIKHQTGEHLGR